MFVVCFYASQLLDSPFLSEAQICIELLQYLLEYAPLLETTDLKYATRLK